MLKRAYAILDVKSIDDEQRIIEGIATTPTTDRMGDIVEPDGATYTLPMPLLWQHQSSQPIGQVIAAKVTAAGIQIRAQIAKGVLPSIDEAWALIKSGLVRGLSIGFREIESSDIVGTWGMRFTKWEWLELSAVTIPANAEANIQTIKSCDTGLAATGTKAGGATRHTRPGATGSTRVGQTRQGTTMKKTYAEQIASFEATRQAKSARMDEILATEEGTTLDAAETEEHDTLEGEIKEIDAHLVRLRAAETRQKAGAVEVKGATALDGSNSRGGGRITVTRELPKGILFARYAMCMGASRGIPIEAARLAKTYYPDDPGVLAMVEKSAVGAAASTTSHWADDLVPYNVMNDFIEYLRPGSIVGKFGGPNPGGGGNYPSLNRVPFNVRVSGASAGLTGAWTGEGLPALLSKMTTFNTTLTWAKVEALAVLTKEEIRFSNPSAEMKVRDDIARAINARIDIDFVDPAKAVVANVSPASITDSVAATTPSGTTAAFFRTDLATMIALFASNNLDPSDIVLIMSAQMALQLSMMVNTLGNNDFPDISMKGGSVRGFPVIVSEHLTSVGSPSTQTIVAVKASDVYLADDGVVTVDASDQAALEMVDSSSQSGVSGTGASMVSLWQSGLLGLLARREITWKLRRSTAVQYLSPAAYKA